MLTAAPAGTQNVNEGTGNVLVEGTLKKGDNFVKKDDLPSYNHPLTLDKKIEHLTSANPTADPAKANTSENNTGTYLATESSPSIVNENTETTPTPTPDNFAIVNNTKHGNIALSEEELLFQQMLNEDKELIMLSEILQSFVNQIRKNEKWMNSFMSPLTGSIKNQFSNPSLFTNTWLPMKSMRVPKIPMPNTNNMKLIDEQTINNGGMQGKIQTFRTNSNPNSETVVKKGTFKTPDGHNGFIQTQTKISSSTSSSSKAQSKPWFTTPISLLQTRFPFASD